MTSWIGRAVRKGRRFFYQVPDDPVQPTIVIMKSARANTLITCPA